MSQLVPGVVPVARRDSAPVPTRPKVDAPLEEIAQTIAGSEAPPDRAALEAERAALEAERAALEAERAALDVDRTALETDRAELDADRAALEEGRSVLEGLLGDVEARAGDLEQTRVAIQEAKRLEDSLNVGLAEVLEDRGLRGADEFERALGALSQARRMRELVPLLTVRDRVATLEVLREVLVLVGGDVPDGLPRGRGGVQVAPDREELPGWESLRRDLGRVGELLLLNGLRRVVVVGGHPTWQRLLREGVDARVDLRFQQAAPRASDEVESDEGRIDVVVFWGGEVTEEPEGGYGGSRLLVVHVGGDDLPGLARAVCAALEED
jgi:hypothetical protein